MPLMKEKRLRMAGVEVSVAVEADRAERLRRSPLFRHAVGPALRGLRGLRERRERPDPGGPANGSARSGTNGLAAEVAALRAAGGSSSPADAIRERVAALEWYHTLELPGGVVTPGFADHREQVPLYGLPDSLAGKRCLDVATFDGFWAFEMERRGAAEVVAIDVESWAECDVPRRLLKEAAEFGGKRVTGPTFELAAELLGSRVDRRLLSVYDLAPEKVGTFDVVFVSDLLLHLRDPQRALESIASVVAPGGYAVVAEPYNPDLEGFKDIAVTQFVAWLGVTWWLPSTSVLKAMLMVAGFDPIEEVSRFQLRCNSARPIHKVVLRGYPGSVRQATAPIPASEERRTS